jgi:hypothetical protein
MEVVLRAFTMLLKEPAGSNRTPMTGSPDQVREDTAGCKRLASLI